MKKVEAHSDDKQTAIINALLGMNNSFYTIDQIFNILPQEINHNGRIGYLRISPIDIVYSSLETEMIGSVVAIFQYVDRDKNIYDGFIEAIKWMLMHDALKRF